jgi:hypothetical protein
MEIYKGKIKGFQGSWGSGLAMLLIKNEDGETDGVPCDNAPTVRALEDCFGNVITKGHTANGQGYIDKEIFYSLESWGTLAGFTPVSEASEKLIQEYEKQKKVSKERNKI